MIMRQHVLPSTTPNARATTTSKDADEKHRLEVRLMQLQTAWNSLTRSIAAWGARRDTLRPYEAKVLKRAKTELDRVEGEIDALRKERAAPKVEPKPEPVEAVEPDVDPLAKAHERAARAPV